MTDQPNQEDDMAQRLDDDAITTALASLAGWERVADTLVKEVEVDDDAADNLEGAVAKAADELNHHPQVDRSSGVTRFTLWTHSDGGVTDKDVELAARIDQVLSGTVQDPPA
jgi:4a-hydroxytetrahydrobiopterin dehydratase